VCLILCDLETSTKMGLGPDLGCSTTKKLHRVEEERNILNAKGYLEWIHILCKGRKDKRDKQTRKEA